MPAIGNPTSGKTWWTLVIAVALAALLLAGGWKWWQVRHYRRAMARIDDEIEQGLPALAARDLIDLLAWRPGSDEAAYWLGACEKMRGRPQAAAEAWNNVPPSSTFWPRAITGRVELEIEEGRLADAERLIKNVNEGPRNDLSDAGILLGPIYCQQGRLEEAKQLIKSRWDHLNQVGQGASEKAINLVRLFTAIRTNAMPVEATRAFLDQAAVSSPDDDRVWLGKANLAIRTGAFDEAARWLNDCLRRHPDDVAVWHACLERGIAANDIDAVRQSLAHLPASGETVAQVDRLAAWLAARRGDAEQERQALERLIAADPTDFRAWDRLAELAIARKQSDRARELQLEKSEIMRIEAQFRKLHERHQPKRDALDMARLAARLGLWFEAKGYLTVAIALYPDREDLRHELTRLDEQGGKNYRTGTLLADLLMPELGDPQPSRAPLTPTRTDP